MATENVNTRTKYAVEIKEYNTTDQSTGNIQKTFAQSSNAGEILVSVSLNQEMYKPSCLEIVIQTNSSSISDFKDKLVSLYTYVPTTGEIILSESNKIVSNYYIFNIKKKGEYITLIAYSPDYFLTLDKFCQAFTAKKMVSEIINPTLRICSNENFEKFRKIASFTEDDQKNINYASSNVVNFLDENKESIIPYAVQYNESFYDFMVRMCNRDGEFLYMDEKNNLCVGLKSKEASGVDLFNITNAEIEYVDSYVENDISDWNYGNYLGKLELKKEHNDNEKEKEDNIKLDYINNFNNTEEKSLKQNYYVLAPEYLEDTGLVTKRDDFSNMGDYTTIFTGLSNAFGYIANERNILDAAASFAKGMSDEYIHYGYWVDSKNKKVKGIFGEKYLYSTNKTVRNNDAYKMLYRKLESSKDGQVKITTSTMPNVKLGDIIEEKGIDGIVINSYVIYEIIKNSVLDEGDLYRENYEILLIKKNETDFYPLPMPEIRFRKSSAQRAIVVDNFDPSRLGRVRVRYPWQSGKVKNDDKENKNDVNATPWIRVSSPMASKDAGFIFTPDINDEVLIDYEDGNIERPYVCGAFYNETNKPAVAAQTQNPGLVKSITSTNGHHISFTDNGGCERFFSSTFKAAQVINSYGVSDKIINGDLIDRYLGGGFEISDYYGIYSIKGSTHNRSISINSPFGDVSINAFTGITINAPLGDVKIVGKNVSIEARNNLTLESGTNIQPYFNCKTTSDWKNKVVDVISSEVLDLSFYRNLIEVFLRPIGGTMLLKSNRFMCLEVGEGKTKIDRQVGNPDFKSIMLTTNRSVMEVVDKTIQDVTQIITKVKSIYDIGNNILRNLDRLVSTSDEELELMRDAIKTMISGNSIISLSKFTNKIENVGESNKTILMYSYENVLNMKNIVDEIYNGVKLRTNLLQPYVDSTWNNFKKCLSNGTPEEYEFEMYNEREIIYNEVKACIESEKNLKDLVEIEAYNHNVRNLNSCIKNKQPQEDDSEISFKELLKDTIYKKNFETFIDDRIWAEPEKGALLVSNKKDEFLKMENNGRFTKSTPYQYAQEIINKLNQHFT